MAGRGNCYRDCHYMVMGICKYEEWNVIGISCEAPMECSFDEIDEEE